MRLFLVLLWAVTYHDCNGYHINAGEIAEDIVIGNDTSTEYLFDTTNVTTSNDSLPLHGFFKKVGGGIKGGIKSIKNKISNLKGKIGGNNGNTGSGTRVGGGGRYVGRIGTNSGSGVKDPENAKWALLGIGGILAVTLGGLTLYYCQKKKPNANSKCELQQVSEK